MSNIQQGISNHEGKSIHPDSNSMHITHYYYNGWRRIFGTKLFSSIGIPIVYKAAMTSRSTLGTSTQRLCSLTRIFLVAACPPVEGLKAALWFN